MVNTSLCDKTEVIPTPAKNCAAASVGGGGGIISGHRFKVG